MLPLTVSMFSFSMAYFVHNREVARQCVEEFIANRMKLEDPNKYLRRLLCVGSNQFVTHKLLNDMESHYHSNPGATSVLNVLRTFVRSRDIAIGQVA